MLSGNGRTIAWSAFGLPVEIVQGLATVRFSYGPERQRYKRIDMGSAGIATTRLAAGGAYEEVSRADGGLEKRHYIAGVAVVSETVSAGIASASTRYLSFDHLGSLDVVTDGEGSVVERFSFDAFGKRRQANWVSFGAVSLFEALTTNRGFTFHEMIDPVGLIHMNGRVYDPELGRFLSADPFLQDLSNLQSWNRYSYVLNNPLSLTDPTGFFFGSIFKAIGSFFSNIFSAITSAIQSLFGKLPILRAAVQIIACGASAIACIATAGVLSLASGGSIGDALQAMALSAFQIGVWTEIGAFLEPFKSLGTGAFAAIKGAVHGAVGGAMAVLDGGELRDGLVSASIGAVAGVMTGQSSLGEIAGAEGRVIRSMVAGAAGGVASVLTGGKFASGAFTAAFAHLWNAEGGKPRGRLFLLDLAVTAVKKLYDNNFMIGPWRQVQFEGRTIYVRDDLIDPLFFVEGRSMTNLQLMHDGSPPMGPDGKPLHLHHILMTDNGPLAEITQTFHQENTVVLHNLYERPHTSLINRGEFGRFRQRYWQWRALQFGSE